MGQTARFQETLPRLAIFDEGFVEAGFGPGPVPRLGGALCPRPPGRREKHWTTDGRHCSLLGRKLAGKSQRELRDLGLTVENSGSPHGHAGQ